jgi:hypothetical protein
VSSSSTEAKLSPQWSGGSALRLANYKRITSLRLANYKRTSQECLHKGYEIFMPLSKLGLLAVAQAVLSNKTLCSAV